MQPQVILITGASSGFGKITAQMLSERGHIVYGTSRIAFLCSRERNLTWQAGQSGTHFAACQPANPAGFTLGKQGGLEPLFACWGNLSPSPFERFLQNRLRSCGAFAPAARQRIAALCECVIDIFSVSGYT